MSAEIHPIANYINCYEYAVQYRRSHVITAVAVILIAALAGALLHHFVYSQWNTILGLGANGTIVTATLTSSLISGVGVLGVYIHYRKNSKEIRKNANTQAFVKALGTSISERSTWDDGLLKKKISYLLEKEYGSSQWRRLFNVLEAAESKALALYTATIAKIPMVNNNQQLISPGSYFRFVYQTAPQMFKYYHKELSTTLQTHTNSTIKELIEPNATEN